MWWRSLRQRIRADYDVTILPAGLSRELELRLGDCGACESNGGDQRHRHRHGWGFRKLFSHGKFGIQGRTDGEKAFHDIEVVMKENKVV